MKFREAPRLEIYPSTTQTVAKGGSVLFQCRVLAGIPAPEVCYLFLFVKIHLAFIKQNSLLNLYMIEFIKFLYVQIEWTRSDGGRMGSSVEILNAGVIR